MTRLSGVGRMSAPASAIDLYEREDGPFPWTEEVQGSVSYLYRTLKEQFKFDRQPDREWKAAKFFKTQSGRSVYHGNCNDFAPMLKERIAGYGRRYGRRYGGENALRLLLCRRFGEGHMVLAIQTMEDTIICCNVAGIAPLWDERWEPYEWLAWEGSGRNWERLKPLTLDQLIDAKPGEVFI